MKLTIPYGDSGELVTIPDARLRAILSVEAAPAGDEAGKVRESAACPVAGSPLDSFLRPGEKHLVLVNDATRPTPTALMLETLWEAIAGTDVEFLVATGTHRPPDDYELARIFGRHWEQVRERVYIHDARDSEQLVRTGRTPSGNDIYLNRRVAAAARILVLGSVETHYFAGYTGGRKIILPGVAGYDTVERNHRLAMEAGASTLVLDGNPVHAEMDAALDTLGATEIFVVLAVLDREHRVQDVFSGDIREAFMAAAGAVDRLCCVLSPGSADIVVAVATHPLDSDFYQAQKAVENGKLVLRDGGILILVSACRAGAGNDAFLEIMREAGSPGRVAELARSGYRLGYHKAARLAELAIRAEMWAVAGVDDDVIRSAFMRPFASVQEALDHALKAKPAADILILMDAGTNVPRLPRSG